MSDTTRDAVGISLLGVLLLLLSVGYTVAHQDYLLSVQECVGDDLSDEAWTQCSRSQR